MAATHYETLGVSPKARAGEIKAAYRKLVLKHHPDRNPDPASPQIFRGIAEAFEVLGDPAARRLYDESLAHKEELRKQDAERARREEQMRDERLRAQAARVAASRLAEDEVQVDVRSYTRVSPTEIDGMVKRLGVLFGRQRIYDSENLAREIIALDPKRPIPYAILGDIARSRGALADAMKMYSFALQMEPKNANFLRQYEEILDRISVEEGRGHRVKIEPQEKRLFAILAITVVTLLACVFLIVSRERPELGGLGLISSWTVGLIAALFACGIFSGAALSAGNLLDRVDSISNAKLPPTVIYGLVSLVSFPIAVMVYAFRGAAQRALSVTTTRIMLAVGSISLCLGLAFAVSNGVSALGQVALWGGNLVYLGAMAGWAVADSLRG